VIAHDRAAGEQPGRALSELGRMGIDEAARLLEPLAQVDPAADHDRLVAAQLADLVRLLDLNLEAMGGEHGTDPLGDLVCCAVLACRRYQDPHRRSPFQP
jgi:hypothetical protein